MKTYDITRLFTFAALFAVVATYSMATLNPVQAAGKTVIHKSALLCLGMGNTKTTASNCMCADMVNMNAKQEPCHRAQMTMPSPPAHQGPGAGSVKTPTH